MCFCTPSPHTRRQKSRVAPRAGRRGQLQAKTLNFLSINGALSGKNFSFLFLPATPLSLSRTLEGLSELTLCPSRALASPRVLVPELQTRGHCQVCCARRRGPRTPSKTTDANLGCAFVENALIARNIGRLRPPFYVDK